MIVSTAQLHTSFKQLAVRGNEDQNWKLFGRMIAEHISDPYKLTATLWEKTRERAERLYGMANIVELFGETPGAIASQYEQLVARYRKELERRARIDQMHYEYMERYVRRNPRADDINLIGRQCECGEFVNFTLYRDYPPKYRRTACRCGRWYRLEDQTIFGTGDLEYAVIAHHHKRHTVKASKTFKLLAVA